MEQESFFNAIRTGDLNKIKSLVKQHPELLTVKDKRGSTPLILGAYYNHQDVVEYLLQKGVNVDEKDGTGNTALMGVCFKGYKDIAELLMKAGADVNTTNAMGSSCLIFAVTFNQLEIAQLLVKHGADIHVRDARGHTALDHAKMQGFRHFQSLLTQ
ncbi:ankyrin repeat domain-containing protein [Muriicola soli]|uniref:Ankyrin repeat domain-containing protein n=1 Tax=Muriicola soli TaxID=2507538 RepID=A0A411ECC1_9FLAO|nr:ankyrin repeat domain-containing protein [Muriicola soli]QBA65184.1 ankyrin repeat domain-containing protein [Muriicola soli]